MRNFLEAAYVWTGRPPKAQMCQVAAHLTYAICSLWIFALQRPIVYYFALAVALVVVHGLLEKTYGAYSKRFFVYSAIGPAGTIFLNMEGYGFWIYLFAGTVAIASKYYFRIGDRHVFNPGALGAFAAVMCFPEFAATSYGAWGAQIWFSALILVIGTYVVGLARRLWLTYSYFASFALAGMVFVPLARLVGLPGYDGMPAFVWPGTLLAGGSMLFAFHVISDPRTTPSDPKAQVLFGAAVGLLDFTFRQYKILPPDFMAYLLVTAAYCALVWKREARAAYA